VSSIQVVRVLVWMLLQDQLTVRPLKFFQGCRGIKPQNCVRVRHLEPKGQSGRTRPGCIGKANSNAYRWEGDFGIYTALIHLYYNYYGHRSTHYSVGNMTSPAPILEIGFRIYRSFRVVIHRDHPGQRYSHISRCGPVSAYYGPLPLALGVL
jgi:hypothetical protein